AEGGRQMLDQPLHLPRKITLQRRISRQDIGGQVAGDRRGFADLMVDELLLVGEREYGSGGQVVHEIGGHGRAGSVPDRELTLMSNDGMRLQLRDDHLDRIDRRGWLLAPDRTTDQAA